MYLSCADIIKNTVKSQALTRVVVLSGQVRVQTCIIAA